MVRITWIVIQLIKERERLLNIILWLSENETSKKKAMEKIINCKASQMVNSKIFLQVVIYTLYVANHDTKRILPSFLSAIENSFSLINVLTWDQRRNFWVMIAYVIVNLNNREVHSILHDDGKTCQIF